MRPCRRRAKSRVAASTGSRPRQGALATVSALQAHQGAEGSFRNCVTSITHISRRGKGGNVSTCWSSAGRQIVRLRAESPLPPPPLSRCCLPHTPTYWCHSLPRTDILVSLGVTVSGAPDSGGAQTGGRGKSANVARRGTRGERRDRSGVVEVRSALPPTAVHAPTRVPSATHFLRTAAYSSALHRLCLLAV